MSDNRNEPEVKSDKSESKSNEQENKKKQEPKSSKKSQTLILGLEVLAVLCSCIFSLWLVFESDINRCYSAPYGGVLILTNLSFLVFFWRAWASADDSLDSNHLRVFLLLLLLNFGSITAYKSFDIYENDQLRKEGHTIGFRAWGSHVEISDLSVVYWNDINDKSMVDAKKLGEEDSWKETSWDGGKKLIIPPFFDVKNGIITLKNSGLVLDHEAFRTDLGIKNVQIRFKAILREIDPKYLAEPKERYHSLQVCLKVPRISGDKYFLDDYVALEFFFNNFSWVKLRNPSLNIDDYSGLAIDVPEKMDKETTEDVNYLQERVLGIEGYSIPQDQELSFNVILRNDNVLLQLIHPVKGDHKTLYDGSLGKYL